MTKALEDVAHHCPPNTFTIARYHSSCATAPWSFSALYATGSPNTSFKRAIPDLGETCDVIHPEISNLIVYNDVCPLNKTLLNSPKKQESGTLVMAIPSKPTTYDILCVQRQKISSTFPQYTFPSQPSRLSRSSRHKVLHWNLLEQSRNGSQSPMITRDGSSFPNPISRLRPMWSMTCTRHAAESL